MALIRRTIHVVAWIGTLLVGAGGARAHRVADALVPRLDPPHDHSRSQAVSERRADHRAGHAATCSSTSGSSDVAVDLSGERVVAIKAVAVDYSVFQLISRGIVIDHITLTAPRVRLARDCRVAGTSGGW